MVPSASIVKMRVYLVASPDNGTKQSGKSCTSGCEDNAFHIADIRAQYERQLQVKLAGSFSHYNITKRKMEICIEQTQ